MIKIAICDDEIRTCSELETCLMDYEKRSDVTIKVEIFYSGEGLCSYLENEVNFDLIFLDIELKKINGVEVGHIIREQRNDNITQIVFISSKENYAMQLFKIRPFDFLVKPVNYENVEKVIDIYTKLSDTQNIFFEYQIGKEIHKITEKEIIYFNSNAKKIRIITVRGTCEFYGKLSVIQTKLTDKIFWNVHKSYIINSLFISEYHVNKIVLCSGEIIPISQVYINIIKRKIMEIQMKGRM